MDLNPVQRRLLFVVVVLALVGLGFYLIKGHGSGTPAAAPSTSASHSSAGTSGNSSSGAASSGAASSGSGGQSVPSSSLPAATPVSTAGGAQIYQWLPFTAADLSAAAQTTTTFAKDYTTWSYTESANAYAAKLSPLVSAQELAVIKNGYSTAGVAQQRTQDKQVSTGSGTIDSIRSFGASPVSITFLVTISQQVTPAQAALSASPQQYAVTVVSSGGAWQVNDLELAGAGNQ